VILVLRVGGSEERLTDEERTENDPPTEGRATEERQEEYLWIVKDVFGVSECSLEREVDGSG
jgi:hypothetical protein